MAARAKVIRPKLPKAKGADLVKVTRARQDFDYERVNERCDQLEALIADTRKNVAELRGAADYWAMVTKRVEDLEKKPAPAAPAPVIVHEEAETFSVWWVLAINDVLLMLWFAIWWNWAALSGWAPTLVR